jgi:hypothetical protein
MSKATSGNNMGAEEAGTPQGGGEGGDLES